MRPAPKSGKRGDMPVFANITDSISSSDTEYLQVLHGRPTIGYPSLKTVRALPVADELYYLIRGWDDLAQPMLSGNEIPNSAKDSRKAPQRQRAIDIYRQSGLRFIAVDQASYTGEGLEVLTRQLAPHTKQIKEFDDGDGVLVFELNQ